ncbi:MAG: hypothetical protein JXA03_15770 [Bacteroidales bacterium]|nr:hypothetical protein [Bacteroidales bacterium]
MTKAIYLLVGLMTVSLITLQTGCKKEDEQKAPATEEVVLSANTKVVDQTQWQSSFISLDSTTNTLMFNSNIDALNLKAGDIIVSAAGEGFLRKVKSINAAEEVVEVQTEDADLEEALQNGEIMVDTPLTISDIKSIEYHYTGISLNTNSYKDPENTLSWGINIVLYDADSNLNTNWDQIRLVGEFSCGWNLVVNIKYSLWSGLTKVKFGFESSENLDLSLIAGLQYEFEKSVTLMTVNFNSFTVTVGTLPVVFTPVLKIIAGVDGYANANITTSFSQELSFDAGIQYIKGDGWSPYKTFNKSLDFTPPQLNINAGAEAYLKPELTIKVYGIKGPYVYLKLYSALDADLFQTPWWSLYGGLDLGAGAKAKVFGKTLFDKHYEGLISYEVLIAQASVPPEPTPVVTTTAINDITLISALGGGDVTDEGGSAVTVRGVCWSTSEGPTTANNITIDGSGTGAFTSNITGLNPNTTYYVRAYATNSEGTAYGSQKVFTTLSPPLAWFPFDGNFNDQSGNNYHGTNLGTIWTTDRYGNLNNALEFDGNSSGVKLTSGYPPVFNGSLTVSMWVYFYDDSRGVLLGSYNTAANVNFEKHTGNRLRIFWNNGQKDFFTPNDVVSSNNWHFVTFVRDKEENEFIIYVDGSEVAYLVDTGSDVSPAGPFYIGRDARTGSTVTHGKIDDVRIYSRALSSQEISDLYNN